MSMKPARPAGQVILPSSLHDARESTLLEAATPRPQAERPGTASMSPQDSLRAAASSAPPWPSHIGKFEIRCLLGSGAFGRVYHGHDPELRRDVAIKVPRPDALTPEFRERFIREARGAAAIRHPNVCPVYDVGNDDRGVPYIVMGFVPGNTLAAVIKLRGGPFPPRQAAGVVRRLAQAVEAAHQKGIVHRDLKPGNVLVDSDRRDVVVTDFGLAKLVGDVDSATTQLGDVLGTPAYMAPEQARGDIDRVGPQSDIYSLGVILYELLTGQVPFRGTVTEVLGQVLGSAPQPASVIRPGLDPRLDAICRRAMARDLANRYASARELAHALGDYLRAAAQPSASDATAAPDVSFDLRASDVLPGSTPPPDTLRTPEEITARFAPRTVNRNRKTYRKNAARRKSQQRRQWFWAGVGLLVMAGSTYGLIRAVRPAPQPVSPGANTVNTATPADKVSEPGTASGKNATPPMVLTPVDEPARNEKPKEPPPMATDPEPAAPPKIETAPAPVKVGDPPMPGGAGGFVPPAGPDGRIPPPGPDGKYPPLGPDGRLPPPPPGPDGKYPPPGFKGKYPPPKKGGPYPPPGAKP